MKRKDFLAKTGVLTTGFLLHLQMMEAFGAGSNGGAIKIGIIGCGDRGLGLVNVLMQLPEKFKIVAICDILPFRLENAKQKVRNNTIAYTNNYKQVLDNKEVDAVIIATPLHLHYQMAKDALDATKHVYLEKTMTYNSGEAIGLVNSYKKTANLTLQVGHQYRYTPLYFKVKDMINKGYLGKVINLDCRWDRNTSWRRPVPEGYTDKQINWRMYRAFSGGVAAELLSHQIDFVNWAFDTHPDEIMATGGIDVYQDGREIYDNVQSVFRYKKAEMNGSFGATCGNKREGYLFKIKGTKGTVELLMSEGIYYPEKDEKKALEIVDGVAGATKIVWNKDGGTPIMNEPQKDGTWYALNEFYKSIKEKIQPASNVYTGAKTAICVDMLNKALYSNTIQNWKPKYNL